MPNRFENLVLVRAILAEWERGNFSSVEWAHPRIEFAVIDEPGAQLDRGVAAMAHRWREFLAAWDDYRVEAEEYRALSEGRVLVALRAQGRGRSSGLEIGATSGSRRSATLFHLRGGKVTRLIPYFDRERAIADVARSEANGRRAIGSDDERPLARRRLSPVGA
jgi:hypothetical protein